MDDNLMYIANYDTQITPSVYYNQWLKRLDTQLNEPANQNLIKVPKDDYQRYYKTFVTSVINLTEIKYIFTL